MNCVTCEKCKVWGKLQILGMGTAIKLLLLTEDEIKAQVAQGKPVLNRQELIALINSFYHMAESVEFAQKVAETELKFKLSNFSFMSISFLQKIVNSMIATLRAMYYELSPKYRVALCCACIVCLMTFVFFVKFFMKKNRRTTGTNNYKKKQ